MKYRPWDLVLIGAVGEAFLSVLLYLIGAVDGETAVLFLIVSAIVAAVSMSYRRRYRLLRRMSENCVIRWVSTRPPGRRWK